MAEKLDEFAVHLPMTTVKTGAESVPGPSYGYHDITANVPVAPEVSQSFEHLTVSVDSASVVSYDPSSPSVQVDLVMNVNVLNPNGASSYHKVIKRLSMDKVKLALEAETQAPYQVVEAETEEQKAAKLLEAQKAERAEKAAKRARELAGLKD